MAIRDFNKMGLDIQLSEINIKNNLFLSNDIAKIVGETIEIPLLYTFNDYESYDSDFEALLQPVLKQLDRIGDVELYLSHYHVREENLATGNFDWNGLLGNPFSWPFNPELAKILPEYPEAFGNKVADSESDSGQENSADDNNDVVAGIPF